MPPVCAGRANLPGSTRERELLNAFARMAPELLRHSDKPEGVDLIPAHLRVVHRPTTVKRDNEPIVAAATQKQVPRSKHTSRPAPAARRGGMWDSMDPSALLSDEDDLPPLVATGVAGVGMGCFGMGMGMAADHTASLHTVDNDDFLDAAGF